ncbi:hypothetical protein AJ79_06831 [Helicocarpus griseus UAMH5409]|uniref:ADF-H domain-containing protein n=1 Tax=Helicocarpus griseus UAMH5409 TaxID=1447875 RepID=A0A2B7X9G5_9EURO|nr:hypothetical protein AJ79_06831 [Helicocarpus griseus UAMH5409]
MSLNGLDDPAVIESYQAALAEAGGWFLLKYVTRDTVALLARGTGGVAEIRISIDAYEETSPLYGFLQYRRRKIILKYVPEGISRLIQARITVQFQSILDKFSPNDTIFPLALSSELTESALSSACLLHTASSSMTSSSSSLRRRRLGEITEDAEESASPKEDPYAPFDNGYEKRRESVFSRTSEATAVPSHHQRGQYSEDISKTDATSRPSRDDVSDSGTDKPPPTVPRNCSESRSNGAAQRHLLDSLSQTLGNSRKSTQSTRPSLRDLDTLSLHRPKVKLGPRPSVDPTGRPRTAGSVSRSNDTRPVASLPSGVRMSTRKSGFSTGRPKSQPDIPVPRLPPSMAPPVPELLIPPPPLNLGYTSRNVPGSPRSVMSVPTSLSVTPEKQRLMRALELRKKQMEKRGGNNENKKKETNSEPPKEEAAKKIEGSKENIEVVRVEVTTPKPERPEVSTAKPDADSSQKPSSESQQQPHPPSAIEVDEKQPIPSMPNPSNTDLDVDLGVKEPANVSQPVTSSPAIASSDTPEKPSNPTSVKSHAAKIAEKENSEEASGPSQDGPQNVESDTDNDTQKQTQNNESPSTQVAERADAPTGALEVSVVEVPSDASSPEATPRGIRAEIVNGIPTPDSQTAPQTPKMASAHIPQADAAEVSPTSQKSAENTPVESPSVAADNHAPKADQDAGEKEPPVANNLKARRKGHVDPIHIVTNLDESDEDNLLSDDSFMEELGSATFQEAKPITVPKTPGSASFGKNGESDPAADWKSSRAVSNPPNSGNTGPDLQALPVGRSASSSYYENQQAVPVLVAKKVNVSSGISKRIKALEMFSSREGPQVPAPQPTPTTPSSSSPFEKFRKRASLSQSSLPPASAFRSKSPSYTPSPSSNRDRSLSPNPPKRAETQLMNDQSRGKSNSVSVTARIIRDPAAPSNEHPADPSEPSVLNLQRSQLIVESDTADSLSRPSMSTITGPGKRSRSSSSSAGSARISSSQGMPRSDSTTSRLSASSRFQHEGHSPSSADFSNSLDRLDEGKEEKKASRTSRMIRRMSSLTTNSRRGIINALSPTLKEEESQSDSINGGNAAPEPPQVIDIGEVNVQFPDTLLWKRRVMRIDDQGYLILTPGTIDGTSRNIIKRYHLSEFRTPFLPDQDRQELPNSIVLDFQDGSTLQCACESRQGQHAILQVLLEAHRSYHQVFPQQ